MNAEEIVGDYLISRKEIQQIWKVGESKAKEMKKNATALAHKKRLFYNRTNVPICCMLELYPLQRKSTLYQSVPGTTSD